MDSVEGVESQALEYQKIEEVFEDKHCEVFDTLLSSGSAYQLKYKLKVLMDQGAYVHGVYRSYFQFFCTEQTLSFPNLLNGALIIIPLSRG